MPEGRSGRGGFLRVKRDVVALAIIFFSQIAFADTNFTSKQCNREIKIDKPAQALTVGERLVFNVSWMGIPVGVGTLEVKEEARKAGRRAFHVIAIAETNDFLSKIYPVHDEVHSFMDAEDFHSLEFRKTLKEGRYRADERIVYDRGRQIGSYESFHNGSKKEIPTPPKVHDFLSAFFWFRLQPIEVGQKLRTIVNSEEKNWDLELDILRVETKHLRRQGSIDTVVVEPKTRLKGILYKRGKATVYFSCDRRRVPVWITLKTPYGPIVGVLQVPKDSTTWLDTTGVK
jgi:hypothetical protein